MITREEMKKICVIYDATRTSLDSALIGQKRVKDIVAKAILCEPNSRILFVGGTGFGKSTLSNFLKSNFKTEKISINDELTVSDIQEQLKDERKMQVLQLEELNRARGNVQNAFIELLVENQMTINKNTYTFDDFYVFATQNNQDISGIFNVNQALYDRFDLCLYFERLTEDEKRTLLFDYMKPSRNLEITLEDLKYVQNIIKNFQFNESDKDILVKATDIIDEMKLNNQDLFTGSNFRGHFYAIKLALLSAITKGGRNYILPSDIAEYIDNLYMHRINQLIAQIGSSNVLEKFDEAKVRILNLKRKDGRHE